MLCNLCKEVSIELLNRGAYHHAPSCSTLDSSSNSCELCFLLKATLERGTSIPSSLCQDSVFGRALREVGREEGVWLLWNGDVARGVRVALRSERAGSMEDQYGQLHIFVSPESPLADKITGREVNPSADSTGAFALMNSWINDCIHNHPGILEDSRVCQDLTDSLTVSNNIPGMLETSWGLREGSENELLPLLPTRIINVGPPDGSHHPFLLESPKGTRAYYITLSHCWGSSKPLITTTFTLAERRERILEISLPKTIKDAVLITRRIGIRYLWIDSLCILQDSVEDWRHEAALMSQYYSKSLLTISAAGSKGSEQGCFLPRYSSSPPVNLNPMQTEIAIKKSTRGCFPCLSPRIPEPTPPCPSTDNDVYISESHFQVPFIYPESSDSRAWILQETALSPRVILFGEKMLAWLCNTKHCTERGDDILHEPSSHYVMAPRLPHHLQRVPGYEITDLAWLFSVRWVTMEASTWWAKMVQNYSARNLTVESDKLPALSGCSRAIQVLNKDIYYAGLWKRALTNDLLWQPVDGKATSRPREYRAPSWSWAAINGEVKCCITGTYDALSTKLIKNLSVKAEYLSSDVFGQVKAMALTLEGNPVRVAIQNQEHGEAGDWATGNRVCALRAIDPPCSCSNCAGEGQEIEKTSQKTISTLASDKGTNSPMLLSNSIGGVEMHVHMPQEQVTIRYTGLEGSEMSNSGPQYTDRNFNLDESRDLLRRQVLEHSGMEIAGLGIFDVESEMDTHSDGLWCLPVNPQFGLLLVLDGTFLFEGNEVPKYRRVGVVKLSLSRTPAHTLTTLVII